MTDDTPASAPEGPLDVALDVAMIIPAFNEASSVPALFDALEPVRSRLARCIVADNNSTDDTAALARERGAIVVHESHQGYGATCLKALAYLRDDPPDVVVFLDADLSDDPAALPDVLGPIHAGDADIVIGSRVALADPGALNVVQRFGNGLACRLMYWTTGRRYRDLGPFRAATWAALERLDMGDRTWGWTVELQMKAATRDLRVIEVDVPYRRRHSGHSKISGTVRGVAKAGTKIITTIIVLWWTERRRRDAPSD